MCRRTREEVEAAVKAAYLEMTAAGVYPSVERLRRSLKMADYLVEDARSRLIDDGAVPVFPSPYAAWRDVDDPFEEKPDDPDADAVRARIAEARAEKEAEAARLPRPPLVMRAKEHRYCGRLLSCR